MFSFLTGTKSEKKATRFFYYRNVSGEILVGGES